MTDTPDTPPDSSETPGAQDVPPDRLSVEAGSEYFDVEKLQRGVAISFKGSRRTNVEEYCVSEGWVRLAVGNRVDRRGKALTVKLQGPVEPYFQDV